MRANSDATVKRPIAYALKIGRASSTVAAKRKKAADAQCAAAWSKSPSTIRMKTSEAERSTKEANDAAKKRADLERKLTDTEVKITKA